MKILKQNLIDVLNNAQVLDTETGYIYFERLWANIQLLRKCSDIVYEELLALDADLKFLPNKCSDLVFLTPDAVEGRLGALPLSFLVAEKFGSNVVVWKEYADIKWGRAKLLGNLDNLSDKTTAVIIQDIVESGTTALKILYMLDTLGINWQIPLHYSVVYGGRSVFGGKIDNNFKKIDRISKENIVFKYGVSVDNLRTGVYRND